MFTIKADQEMRDIVRETIRGQVITLVKDDVAKEVELGLRRARGPGNTDLYPFIMQACERVAKQKIEEALKNFSVVGETRKIIDEKVASLIGDDLAAQIREKVKEAVSRIDVASAVKKQIEKIRVTM